MQTLLIGICALFVCSLAGAAVSWFAIRRQISRATSETRAEVSVLQEQLASLSAEWRQRELELPKPGPPRNGFNLNRRAEAVRGIRAGHSAERLAAGTGWSVPEVSLLLKIEQMVAVGRKFS